jgi:hypothetical protein
MPKGSVGGMGTDLVVLFSDVRVMLSFAVTLCGVGFIRFWAVKSKAPYELADGSYINRNLLQ